VPRHGVHFAGITTKGFGPHGLKEFVAGTYAVVRGMGQANRYLANEHVEAIVGTGGYASASVVLAGALRGIPIVLHEPNAVAGKANRWLSIFASRVALGFDVSGQLLPPRKCVVTGVAVRTPPVPVDATEARIKFGLAPDTPTLLAVGGSQGAVALNENLVRSLDSLGAMGFQILHQTGPQHFEETARNEMASRPFYRAVPYIEDMPAAYAAADVAICRAGASTVAELALHGVPAILVPFPHAADDHQRGNARIFEEAGAAFSIDQKDLTPATLCALLEQLKSAEKRTVMRTAMSAMAKPRAADDVARLALTLAGREQTDLPEAAMR
jgi:UDP-N-acetylglucosamine--N-acetylmuramyl-(pentapeptide) pyrophosphoryl-undecaprenol N-acetylglucosamine transferase